jgi:hypothetical protein
VTAHLPELSLTRWALPGLFLLLLLVGCSGGWKEVRGRPPSGAAVAVASLASVPEKRTVTVRGRMVEK